MIWYIIRHAEKEQGDFYNPVLRHQDQPISANGQVEAKSLLSYFTGKSIAKIYASEYIRTGQTIEYVAENLGMAPILDRRLNEIDNGVIDGMSEAEVRQKFPEFWNCFQMRDRDFQFPAGESGEEAQRRISSFFDEKKKVQGDIVLVTHDGWIRLLMCTLLGVPVYRRWDFRVDTCGIMEIAYQPEYETWKIIRFNHICKEIGNRSKVI